MKALLLSRLKKYFIVMGVFLHISTILGLSVLLMKVHSLGMPLPLFSEKTQNYLSVNQPNLYSFSSPTLKAMSAFKVENNYFRSINLIDWQGRGARNKPVTAMRADIYVSNTGELIQGLKVITAGQTMVITPGEYYVKQSQLSLVNDGLKDKPIRITATPGTVKIYLRGEGFIVNKPFWQFSNLHLIGSCDNHSYCEHAFHVVGDGDHALIENNIIQDFNAMIKVNGYMDRDSYPDNGVIKQNTFFNKTPRKTRNPVTPIDLMHAHNWLVSENFIFDIQKSGGDNISYAAFFKGGSQSGIFEKNLIICAANLDDDYTSLGLSFGGGGSNRGHRRDKNTAEHVGGIMRNNIIMHCSNDVGIYLNRAENSLIAQNTLYNTLGIDVRFKESSATITNNVISGRIKRRNNGEYILKGNLVYDRAFFTGRDLLSNFAVAPDIGDFTWINEVEIEKSKQVLHKDFCGREVNLSYIGAFSGKIFCLETLNLMPSLNKKPQL